MRESRVHDYPCEDLPIAKPFDWFNRQWSTVREDRASRVLQSGADYAQNRPSQGSKNYARERAYRSRQTFEKAVRKALQDSKVAQATCTMEARIEFNTADLRASLDRLQTRLKGKTPNRKARRKLKSLQDAIDTQTDRIQSYY